MASQRWNSTETCVRPVQSKGVLVRYSVDAMRQITISAGVFPFAFDVAFLVVFAVAMVGIAIPLFKRE